jgi:flavin-binding protein dodecin
LARGPLAHCTTQAKEASLSVARTTEITALSTRSFEDAIREGIERSSKTLHNLKSSWIKEQEVLLNDGKVDQYNVTMKVTFVLDD